MRINVRIYKRDFLWQDKGTTPILSGGNPNGNYTINHAGNANDFD